MKLSKSKIISVISVVFFSFVLLACGGSDDHDPVITEPTMNIVDTAVEDGRFTTLVAALQAAELDDDLSGPGPFTVFAPTDDAFNLLPPGTVDSLLEPANQSTLIDLLLYHVIDGEVFASDAIDLDGKSAAMLNALNVRLDVINGDLILNFNGSRQATVTVTDIVATNGVIHVIDAVLDPGDAVDNIVDTAVANGNFTTLVTALQAADLDVDLEGPGPFTVFAPTDDAFDALDALSPGIVASLLLPANKATLIDILTYHVFNGSVLSPAAIALDGQSVTMLNGGSMAIDVAASELFLNLGGNRQATVTIKDVLCSNGVIHVIDAVLDPAD
jgi:uncharacterized surface protein with fasciclin (FAS1) repeats